MNSPVEWEDKPVKILRDKVITKLKTHYALDHLDNDDFEQRLDVATNTKSKKELLSLITDLPEVQSSDAEQKQKYPLINKDEIRNAETITNIFGGTDRTGVWLPPKQLNVLNIFGGTDIDFREAKLKAGETKITITCIFGGMNIIVPPGINVITNIISIFGGTDNKTSGEVFPEAPTIVIEGFAMFGGIDIEVKPRRKKE